MKKPVIVVLISTCIVLFGSFGAGALVGMDLYVNAIISPTLAIIWLMLSGVFDVI